MEAQVWSWFDFYKSKSWWHRCSGKCLPVKSTQTKQRPQWSRRFNNRTTLTPEWAHMYPNNVQKRTEMIENHWEAMHIFTKVHHGTQNPHRIVPRIPTYCTLRQLKRRLWPVFKQNKFFIPVHVLRRKNRFHICVRVRVRLAWFKQRNAVYTFCSMVFCGPPYQSKTKFKRACFHKQMHNSDDVWHKWPYYCICLLIITLNVLIQTHTQKRQTFLKKHKNNQKHRKWVKRIETAWPWNNLKRSENQHKTIYWKQRKTKLDKHKTSNTSKQDWKTSNTAKQTTKDKTNKQTYKVKTTCKLGWIWRKMAKNCWTQKENFCFGCNRVVQPSSIKPPHNPFQTEENWLAQQREPGENIKAKYERIIQRQRGRERPITGLDVPVDCQDVFDLWVPQFNNWSQAPHPPVGPKRNCKSKLRQHILGTHPSYMPSLAGLTSNAQRKRGRENISSFSFFFLAFPSWNAVLRFPLADC